MTLKEAYALLDATVCNPDKASKINPQISELDAVEFTRKGLATWGQRHGTFLGPDDPIDPDAERRVLQVTQNRKKPK